MFRTVSITMTESKRRTAPNVRGLRTNATHTVVSTASQSEIMTQ